VFAGIFRTTAAGGTSALCAAVIDRADGDGHIRSPKGFPGNLTAAGTAVRIRAGVTVHTAASESHRGVLRCAL
jgi:hypothetical protein